MGRRRYSEDPLKTVQILGQKVEIHVDSDGEFRAKVGLDFLKADTLKALVAKARTAAQKTRVKVSIPATLVGVQEWNGTGYSRQYKGMTCKRVTLTGINPKSERLNFVYENGTPGTQERFGDRYDIGKPMTDAEIAEWKRLYKAKVSTADTFHKYEEKWKMKDPFKIVQDAMAAALDDAHEDDAVDDDDPRSLADAIITVDRPRQPRRDRHGKNRRGSETGSERSDQA